MAVDKRWSGVILAVIVAYLLATRGRYLTQEEPAPDVTIARFEATNQSRACIGLADALPQRLYSRQHPGFQKSAKSYWSLTAAEKTPTCVVQPESADDVAAAVRYLKSEFDAGRDARFAVRSGGHSPQAAFSNIEEGVLIDMSLINEVTVSKDKAVLGVGARWHDVSSKLDSLGRAIIGGRNSHVGVGGLVLGGGISFFSPRFGMVCDNIDQYEIVLANGTITQVSATMHPDLWRALKGGTGNFGIVTRVTTHTFPSEKIWAGYGYWSDWQTPRLLEAFHDFNKPENFDPYAGGPIMAMSYVGNLGLRLTVSSLSYTKPEAWPPVFARFKSIWRLWSTTKVQSLSDATEELNKLSPPGRRQFQITTTVKNDLETLQAINTIYTKGLDNAKSVKGAVWSLVFQPLSSAVTRKGSPNVLGLETREANDTLIIVLIAASWLDTNHDEVAKRAARDMIALINDYAREKGTADPYIYLNYAAIDQDVFGSYGAKNKAFMQATSKTYDPDGFYQLAKRGGFKLDMY